MLMAIRIAAIGSPGIELAVLPAPRVSPGARRTVC